MNSYGFLAGCYDEFTTDVDYAAWAEYIQRHFERAGLPHRLPHPRAVPAGI